MKTVAHTVKSVPGNLVDGVSMVSDSLTDGISKVLSMNKVNMTLIKTKINFQYPVTLQVNL